MVQKVDKTDQFRGDKIKQTTNKLPIFHNTYDQYWDFPGDIVVKNVPANAGDTGSIPGSGRSPGGGNGNPHQYSFLENPMDREAYQAIVQVVAKSHTRLSTEHA